jgi:hypothetical protein
LSPLLGLISRYLAIRSSDPAALISPPADRGPLPQAPPRWPVDPGWRGEIQARRLPAWPPLPGGDLRLSGGWLRRCALF